MSKPTHKLRGIRPFERHSLVLAVAGAVYILIGVSYLIQTPTAERLDALYYANHILEYTEWGWVFMSVGVLSIISARWPPISETWGYTVMTGLSAGWAAFFAAGVVFHDSSEFNLTAALSWSLIAFLWWAISGLVNPRDGYRDHRHRAAEAENQELYKEINRIHREE